MARIEFATLIFSSQGFRPLGFVSRVFGSQEVSLRIQNPIAADVPSDYLRSEKSQNEGSPNFSNCCPEFCLEFLSAFSPKILRSLRASFRGKRRPAKIRQKSPPFFNAKFPGKYEKKKFTRFFWRGGKVRLPSSYLQNIDAYVSWFLFLSPKQIMSNHSRSCELMALFLLKHARFLLKECLIFKIA